MQIGDKYLAEWWFGYDMVDNLKGVITIVNMRKGHNDKDCYSFNYQGKWGMEQYNSTQCRSIELIKKIEDEFI